MTVVYGTWTRFVLRSLGREVIVGVGALEKRSGLGTNAENHDVEASQVLNHLVAMLNIV